MQDRYQPSADDIPRYKVRSAPPQVSNESTFRHFAQMATQLPAGVNLDSPQIKLWIESHHAFHQMKVDSFANLLHKDFRYVLLPRSLGQPEKTKDEALAQLRGLLGHVTEIEVGNTHCHANCLNLDLLLSSRPSIQSLRPRGNS